MVKVIPLILFLYALVACSPTSKESGSADSTALGDTIDIADIPDDTISTSQLTVTGDTSQLVARFDEISEAYTTNTDDYYTVLITTQQYEASSDVTWYFDDKFLPRYFKMSWAAEGNEGSTEYFIDQNDVICALEEGSNRTKKWCATTGGTLTIWNENTDTSTIELLENDFGALANDGLERYMSVLTDILNEGEITEKDENSYTVRIEKTVNVGTEVTESTEVKIPIKLYESIKGE